jgi:hypothetical protein
MVTLVSGPLDAGRNDPESLRTQAGEFWQARIKADWATVYKYLTPEEKRTITRDEFTAKAKGENPFIYHQCKVTAVETDGDLGWVKVESSLQPVRYPDLPAQQVQLWQVWKMGDENWYLLPKELEETMPTAPPSLRSRGEEEVLSQKANEYWVAKEEQDWAKVYQYCDPEFRTDTSKDEFLGKKALYLYLSHKVQWAEVARDKGRVRITYSYTYNDPNMSQFNPVENSVTEDWVKVAGNWYRQVQQSE